MLVTISPGIACARDNVRKDLYARPVLLHAATAPSLGIRAFLQTHVIIGRGFVLTLTGYLMSTLAGKYSQLPVYQI
jgi:hypothetical protein